MADAYAAIINDARAAIADGEEPDGKAFEERIRAVAGNAVAEVQVERGLVRGQGQRLADGVVRACVLAVADPNLPVHDRGGPVPGEHEGVAALVAAHLHVPGDRRPRAQAP